MARKVINEVGNRYGRLTVISEAGRNKHKKVMWNCKCDCGAETIVAGGSLRNGNSKSCGCFNRERVSEVNKGRTGKDNPMFGRTGKDHPMFGRTGKDHPSWNPFLTDEDRAQSRHYPEYNEWRTAVYKKDNYTCQCCGKKGGTLNAHHLENYSSNKELRTAVSNGITLCKKCHKNFHHQYGYGDNTRQQFIEFLGQK